MPQQSTRATPRLDLAEAFVEYDLSQAGYIGHQVLPIVEVQEKAANFTKIKREDMLRDGDLKRAPRSSYNRADYEVEDDSYACVEYGQEHVLDDSERNHYASDFDAEKYAAEQALHKVLRAYEKRVAAAVFNATTWTGASLTTAVGTEWSTTSADVLGDVEAAKEKVRAATGHRADTLIMSRKVLNNLRRNTNVIDAIKYVTQATYANVINALAAYFDVRNILVGDPVENTANEGQSAVIADIWDDEYVMVCKAKPMNGDLGTTLPAPGVGMSPLWVPDSPGLVVVEDYREEQTRGTVFRARHHIDEKIIAPEFGHLLSNITA